MNRKWTHAESVLNLDHPADPHHASDGKWVCFKCRELVKLRRRWSNSWWKA